MTSEKDKTSHSEQQAKAQLESIREMVAALRDAETGDDRAPNYKAREDAEETIQQDPLSVEVRSGWYSLGARDADTKPAEFMILLCTGGPACRIIGNLSEYCEPESARIEHQDWFTPWTEYRITKDEEADVLTYCRQFYFGE